MLTSFKLIATTPLYTQVDLELYWGARKQMLRQIMREPREKVSVQVRQKLGPQVWQQVQRPLMSALKEYV